MPAAFLFRAAIASATLLIGSLSGATTYTFTTLTYPGAKATTAAGVNNTGSIVGYFVDQQSLTHGFIYANGAFTQIDVGGSCKHTYLEGINDVGTLSGYCQQGEANPTEIAFVGTPGTFTLFSIQDTTVTQGAGINNNGLSTGTFDSAGGQFASGAFVALNGKIVSVTPIPEYSLSFGSGINNSNVVVGWSNEGGYILEGSSYKFYQLPGASLTEFTGINDTGEIVGTVYFNQANQPFTFIKGVYSGIGITLSTTHASALGVNNAGVIVGSYGIAPLYKPIGFIATPQ